MASISFVDFASRVGVSKQAISKAVRGRLREAVVTDGSRPALDLAKAMELWNTGNRREARQPALATPDAAAVAAAVLALPETAIPAIGISLERKEHWRAELAELEARKAKGELLDAADVKQTAFTSGRQTRDALMALPARLSADLAAALDRFEVEQLLEAAITDALLALVDG